MVKSIKLVTAGIVAGSLMSVGAIRESRNPQSLLYALRMKAGDPPQDTSELNYLARKYGPSRDSMDAEEWIVRDFFGDKKQGVFVDIGAAHYKENSNTYFLEKQLGWSGVAVDAQPSYRADYEKFRPRTKFLSFFVSDHSNDKIRFFLAAQAGASSSQADFSASYGGVKGSTEVQTIALNDLLPAQGVTKFDFLSMDIELAEPKALAGLDLQRFHPELAVVETHPEVRQQILDYFTGNRYTVVGKYLRLDRENLWFMPLGSRVEPFPPEHTPEEWTK